MSDRRRLISSAEATPAKSQHTTPCTDCPFARTALPGWLGLSTADEWVQEAHGEAIIDCHVHTGAQCAGSSIYRRNVAKSVCDPRALVLEANRETVFGSPSEFKDFHEGGVCFYTCCECASQGTGLGGVCQFCDHRFCPRCGSKTVGTNQ